MIELRAWDKKNKIYIYITGFMIDENIIKLWWKYDDHTNSIFDESFPIDQIILEQYTTKKDKNSKKIYAGDIVKYEYWEYVIIFNKGGFVMERDDRLQYYFPIPNNKLKIIGNIHEVTK